MTNILDRNKQAIFDYVCEKLAGQGRPSYNKQAGTNRCRYRTEDLRCAVGWLIDDEQYRPQFETMPLPHIVCFLGKIDDPTPEDQYHTTFLNRIQRAHDWTTIPAIHKKYFDADGRWKNPFDDGNIASNLLEVAKQYGLKNDAVFKYFDPKITIPAPAPVLTVDTKQKELEPA